MLRLVNNGCALLRSLGRCQRGVAAVEWGLMSPFLIMLVLGAIDFAGVSHHKMQMENAVRSGVQYVTVRKPVQGDMSGIAGAVATAAPTDETGTREITVTAFCECPDGTPVACDAACAGGDRQSHVSIVMEEQHNLMLGFLIASTSMTLSAEGSVRLN